MTAPQGPSKHVWKFVVGAIVVVLVGGILFYSLGRLNWVDKLTGENEEPEPPPSEAMKNAPGPDNTITELPPTAHQQQPPSPIKPEPVPLKPIPTQESPK